MRVTGDVDVYFCFTKRIKALHIALHH